jgi:HSP20 family protein
MAMTRWAPARDLDALQSDMNTFLDRFFDGGSSRISGSRRWLPALDVTETEADLIVYADLPGMRQDDVDLQIKDDVLTISGERRSDAEENSESYHRVERSFGTFSRALRLPHGVEPDRVRASFTDGVLEVRVPKPREPEATRVQITAGDVNGKAVEKTD